MQEGQILLLTDKEYELYLKQTQDAKIFHSARSEPQQRLSQTTARLTDQESSDLLADEHKNHFKKIVHNLGFKESTHHSRLIPVIDKYEKSCSRKEFQSLIKKLSDSVPKTECDHITIHKPDKPIRKKSVKRKSVLDSAKAEEAIRLTDEVIMYGKLVDIYSSNSCSASNRHVKTHSISDDSLNPPTSKAATLRNNGSDLPVGKPTRLSREVLQRYYSEAVNNIPGKLLYEYTTATSDNYISPLSSSSLLKSPARNLIRKQKRRPTSKETIQSKSDTSLKCSYFNARNLERETEQRLLLEKREQKKQEEEKMFKRSIRDLRNQYKSKQKEEGKDTLGELLCIMFDKNPAENIESSDKMDDKVKSLHSKLYRLLAEDPSEIYRIVNIPDYSKTTLTEKMLKEDGEWTEEHELAFKSLLRKTHSFNSIAKTRMFKEIEKKLPENKHIMNMEWKYDKHSPWMNDADYHDSKYFQIDEPGKPRKATISNLARTLPKDSQKTNDEILKEEIEKLRKKTGETTSRNVLGIKKAAEKMEKLKTFQEGLAGFEMMNEWEKSPERLNSAKVKLADHIIGQNFIEMKNLNKVRYSYLSSKIAYQRAKTEYQDKVLQKAEIKRQALRRRQEEHLRMANIYRAYCKKKYGDIKLNIRRTLVNTSYVIGSPLFRQYMIKLGYLPKEIEPTPTRIQYFDIESRKILKFGFPSDSVKNLSSWNLPKSYKAQHKVYMSQHAAASKIQACIKGFLIRSRRRKYRKSVRKILYRYRLYRLKKLILKCIILEQLQRPKNLLSSLLYRIQHTQFYNSAIRSIAAKEGYDLHQLNSQLFKKPSDSISIDISSSQAKSPTATEIFRDVSFNISPYSRNSHDNTDYLPVSSKYLRKKPNRITFSTLPASEEPRSLSPSHGGLTNLPSPTRLESILRKEVQVLDDLRDKISVINGRVERPMLETLAIKINHLRRQIIKTRLEMWRLYIGSVTNSIPTDDELLHLLSRDSVYIKTCKKQFLKLGNWQETYIDIPATKDARVIEITADDLIDQPVDHIIQCLLQELHQAIEANNEVKLKYQRHMNLQKKLSELEMSSSTIDLFAKKTVLLSKVPEVSSEELVKNVMRRSSIMK